MKTKILFLADFFSEDLLGGAESNDFVLLRFLEEKNYDVKKVRCREVNVQFLSNFDDDTKLIISNFVTLKEDAKLYIQEKMQYIIYEHDHKYVTTRDPSKFPNFEIPKNNIINKRFYENASAVVVLSEICKKVLINNLSLSNVHNIGTSLWTKQRLDKIKEMSNNEKNVAYGVLNSKNSIKGTKQALEWCNNKQITPTLIASQNEEEFLEMLSRCEKFIFIPQVLETFNRLTAEAKMLNCKVVTNKTLLGFASEQTYELSGIKLIEETEKRIENALSLFEELIKEEKEENEAKVSAVLLVWKRVESTKTLVEQVQKIKQIDEIILWNNNQDFHYTKDMFGIDNITIINSHINKITFGRYLGAFLAKNQEVFVQDDDWNIKDFKFIYDKYKSSKSDIVAVCPKTHMQDLERNKFVGWGSIFNKKALNVFEKYISKYGEDHLLYREADLLFTNCNSYRKFETVPELLVKDDDRSLSLKRDHFEHHYRMLERVKEVKNV